jgi:hypothetical protein
MSTENRSFCFEVSPKAFYYQYSSAAISSLRTTALNLCSILNVIVWHLLVQMLESLSQELRGDIINE